MVKYLLIKGHVKYAVSMPRPGPLPFSCPTIPQMNKTIQRGRVQQSTVSRPHDLHYSGLKEKEQKGLVWHNLEWTAECHLLMHVYMPLILLLYCGKQGMGICTIREENRIIWQVDVLWT